MLGGRRNPDDDDGGLRAHYLATQRPMKYGGYDHSAMSGGNPRHRGGGSYAYGKLGAAVDDPFLSRGLSQSGSPKKLLLYSLAALVSFAAVFAFFEESGGAGRSRSSRITIDTAGIEACAGVEIEGAENIELKLERHDDEQTHGDICRSASGPAGPFGCPKGCTQTGSRPPWCQKRGTTKPCRVKRSGDGALMYRCDMQGGERGVCVKVGEGNGKDFKGGRGKYKDSTCDNQCPNESKPGSDSGASTSGGLKALLRSTSHSKSSEFKCQSDYDCSLAGICAVTGKCNCDPWATGLDCSYLQFQPLDPNKLGYLHNEHTSWGGSVQVGVKDGMFHMFVSEIVCDANDLERSRCGLAKWRTNSRVVHAVSPTVEGPYNRVGVVLAEEHHNPTVAVSPVDNSWNLYSISAYAGPIEVITSTDDGYTWTDPVVVSKFQNPAPLLHADGTATMFYRGDGGNLPSPTCSSEYVAAQHCPSKSEPCENKKGKPIFGHTAEDPMVFRDHRGNYHMLMNAMPYFCVPKINQGGHSWSRDGIMWSEPRVGAFSANILLNDDRTIQCERRERPQVVLDPKGPGVPLALVSAVTGCPKGVFPGGYRGGDDSFTLVQLLGQ